MKREDSIGRFIGMLHRYMRMCFEQEVYRFGIPDPWFHYLVRLRHEDGVSQEELAEFHHDDGATVARAVKTEGGALHRAGIGRQR